MQLVDTHTHLFLHQFDTDRDATIDRAIRCGVEKMILPNIDSSTIPSVKAICNQFPNHCFPMIGLHPCDVKKESFENELKIVEQEAKTENYIGIGEIGIDLYWDKTTLQIQQEAFVFQLNLAQKFLLPVAIHVRDSFQETISIVEKCNSENLSGVFHCFTGNIQEAERIIQLGNFYLGIGGVLTFNNSNLREVLRAIPLQNLLLETDSPYLTPTPFRGKRNESSFLIYIAQKLAEIKNVSVEEVALQTTKNAQKLFQF